ncbi:hypothetical protein NL108_017694 [Boleophthalmus pectinirostris]|uniref:deleted in malignant brain tumors 1 protein-like n=1 Tax=Boleophthalmus pectinirostris TaxID=150288 RepID=UPI00242F9925|nr:deleted in malignant brain tumors 1 protein-like [Boleophthalmus pectinirostris]KAJ0068225.1 hypothetical protein NL108_017694 [Boleophthalmus pectinirostris]
MAKTMHLLGNGKRLFIWFLSFLSLPLCADGQRVRLFPGKCSGRVEVLYDNRWGTVCDDHWNAATSNVLCREVGCGPMVSNRKPTEHATGDIWLDDVRCKGNESSILSCQHSDFGDHNCDHSEDAGVVCSEPMRLSNGTDRCSGTLEVFHGGQWGVICSNNLPTNITKLICEQLDCGPPKKTAATVQNHMGFMSSCPGNAASLSQCTLTKSSEVCHGVTFSCEGLREIRLVNGTDRCSGRVEVYYNKQWGTVCDDNWDILDARVVCRAMDCGAAQEAVLYSQFGEGTGDIWLDSVECLGNETSLDHCQHKPVGDHNCGHSEDAGVICSSHVRLINGTTSCSGRVELGVGGQWVSARRATWGKNEAIVICRELDCGEDSSVSGSNSANEPSRMFDVTCTGSEAALGECTIKEYNRTSGDRAEDATVVCTGKTLLSEGPNRCAGRVEIFHKGLWADVCTDSWDIYDAQVVCNQLNCGAPHKIITVPGRTTDQKLWVNQTVCNGREVSISLCQLQFSNQSCANTAVAGVICADGLAVQLRGEDRCSGLVSVRQGERWGMVCNSAWNYNKAKVICDMLECGHVANVSASFPFSSQTAVLPIYDASDTCFNSLESIHKCSSSGFTASRCGHDKDVGIVCGGDASIRLVNGSDHCSGRVEILYKGKWGTVCDDDWDILDAQVVCRASKCGSAIMALPGSYFGDGAGNIWLDDVECLGNETSLLHCRHPDLGNNNCGHREDAGVMCSAHLRLLDGPDQCSGNVEVNYNGDWLPALNTRWGMNEATVVCREMNCGDAKAVTGSFTQREVQRGFKITCTGRERSIGLCTVQDYTRTDPEQLKYASVTCSGIVKLVGGPNRCAGRLEMFHKGQWGDVCGQSWDMNDAEVVCQQLNCGKAFKLTTDSSQYGLGRGGFNVEHIACNGRESLVQHCAITHGGKNCNASSVAAVICSDSLNIRLVGGIDRCSGRVEVRMGSVWGSVCGADWSVERAETLCELLECGQAINVTTVPHKAAVAVSDPAQSCFSSVHSLKMCLNSGLPRATCAQGDASLVCAAQLRLVGGPNSCAGRVEVFHKGDWGTVCDDDWDLAEAKVVCRQLGCGLPVSVGTYGRGSGQIWLDNMHCSGTESVMTQCGHNGWANHNCGHDEDAGVTCLDTFEKPRILMSPGPVVIWGERVDITCTLSSQQNGRGTFALRKSNTTFRMEKSTENQAAVFSLLQVNLSLNGFYYCEYQKRVSRDVIYYPEGAAAELTVTVRLEKPTLSMTSVYPMVVSSKENISISRGHSCNMTCSVHSPFPGGFFYLTKSKVKLNEPKPAVHLSDHVVAVFEFSYMDYLHQGEYSCVFGVNMSSQTFESAPSQSLHVTVAAHTAASVAVGIVMTLLLLAALGGVGYFIWWKKRWNTDSIVGFVNRVGGAIQNIGNNGRAGAAVPHSFSNVNMDMDGVEDTPGIVFHDHEPLVYSN